MQICMILRDVVLFHYFQIICLWTMATRGNGIKKNAKKQKVRFKKIYSQNGAGRMELSAYQIAELTQLRMTTNQEAS